MAGHTRRFNPSHQWIKNKINKGELNIQQMDVQTYFFRRKNLNALGQPRSWTDHLLWHHACHTVDLFSYQTGEKIIQVQAMEGPIHSELGIAMDMSIGLKSESGAICTLSLSFNTTHLLEHSLDIFVTMAHLLRVMMTWLMVTKNQLT